VRQLVFQFAVSPHADGGYLMRMVIIETGASLRLMQAWARFDAIRRFAASLHSRGVTEPRSSTVAPVPQVVVLEISLPFSRINRRRPTTHRAPTPPMVIEGRVLCLLVLVRLAHTHKLANQSLLLPLQLMSSGAPTPACHPLAKAGHLNHNLTHPRPVAFLPFLSTP
jgi:hypothetical protein